MAVSATFAADFTSFYSAIDKADVKLRGLDSSSRFVERGLNRLVDNFSGRKLIQEATLMADAVERIGGKSKLTEAELQSVGNKAAEAAEKMKRLGIEVPPKLEALAQSAQKPVSAFQSLIGTMGKLNPLMAAFGATLSVGAVIGFAKGIGDFAGEMLDLSAQTSLTTTRLQAFNLVGAGVGLTIENIAGSADQLSKRIGQGDQSVVEALGKMNLSIDDLRNKGLDEVMFDIDKALVGVNNKFERAEILADLFGKSGAKMGRLMTGSLEEVTKAAEETGGIMDEELLKKADAFDDAWKQGWIKFRAYAVDALSFVGQKIEEIRAAGDRMVPTGFRSGSFTSQDAEKMGLGGLAARLRDLEKAAKKAPGAFIGPRQVPKAGTVLGAGVPEIDKNAQAMREWNEELEKAFEATRKWVEQLNTEFALAQDAAFFNAGVSDATKALQKLAMRVGLIGNMPGALQASQISTGLSMFGPQNIGGNAQGGAGVGMQAGDLTPQLERAWETIERVFAAGFYDLGQIATGAFGKLVADVNDVFFAMEVASQGGQRIVSGLRQGGVQGGADAVVGGLQTFAALDAATAQGSRAKRVLGGAGSGASSGAAIGSFFGPIGTGVGAAIGGIGGALVGLFRGPSEGERLNEVRDTLIKAAGGVDALRAKADEAGVSIDRMLSTRKIASFDEEMRKISTAFDDMAADQERLTAAVEKYGFTIEELGPKLQKQKLDDQAKELIEDWRVLVGAGVNIDAVNARMAESINEYLQTAINVGAEVPKAMRPILEKMVEQGTLTDEAGNAITDLEDAGITFSESMTEGFDKVVKKLDELIAKLVAAGTAIGNLPSVPESSGFLPGDQAPSGVWDPTRGGTHTPDFQEFAGGTRGRFLDFGRGTPAMLHGRERVVTAAEGQAEAAGWAYVGDRVDSLSEQLQRMTEGLQRGMRDNIAMAMGQRV